MQKLTPCLWFNFNADEAVEHYLAIFKNGEVLEVTHYGDAVPSLKGEVLTMRFIIEGQEFLALNAGPQFPFTEAISISVDCADQAEVDRLWARLSDGGSTRMIFVLIVMTLAVLAALLPALPDETVLVAVSPTPSYVPCWRWRRRAREQAGLLSVEDMHVRQSGIGHATSVAGGAS